MLPKKPREPRELQQQDQDREPRNSDGDRDLSLGEGGTMRRLHVQVMFHGTTGFEKVRPRPNSHMYEAPGVAPTTE
jgi:hypothetical protein